MVFIDVNIFSLPEDKTKRDHGKPKDRPKETVDKEEPGSFISILLNDIFQLVLLPHPLGFILCLSILKGQGACRFEYGADRVANILVPLCRNRTDI